MLKLRYRPVALPQLDIMAVNKLLSLFHGRFVVVTNETNCFLEVAVRTDNVRAILWHDERQAGGLSELAVSQPAAFLIGSGSITVAMKLHFWHSNVRFSEPSLRCSFFVNSIRLRHLLQRGRSTRLNVRFMTATQQARVRELAVTENCRGRSGDEKLYSRAERNVCPLLDTNHKLFVCVLLPMHAVVARSFLPPKATATKRLPRSFPSNELGAAFMLDAVRK